MTAPLMKPRDLLEARLASRSVKEEAAPVMPEPMCAADVEADDPVAWAVADMITDGDYGMFGGEDGSMKSKINAHIAAARAGGYAAFGRFATKQCRVLIVSEEDSAAVLVNCIKAFCRGHGWNESVVLSNIFIFAKCEVRLIDPGWQAWLAAKVIALDIGHVVIDPYIEVSTGDENSSSDGRVDLQVLRGLTKPTGANVVLVHHFGKPGKPTDGKRLKDRLRGNTAITSGSRFTYCVEHDEDARELRVTCVKLSRGEKLKPFVIRYFIDAEPDNRAVWTSARFEYVTAAAAVLDKADAFVLAQLQGDIRLNTSELKDAAKGSGVSGADIARALKLLEMRRQIDFVPGPKGAKQWGLICLPTDSGQPRQPEIQLAGQPECLPGNQLGAEFCLPSPFRGKQEPATGAIQQ